MSDSTPLDGNLANQLWLHGHAAEHYVHDAIAATFEVDDLIRKALGTDTNVDEVAAVSFLTPDLIRHVQDGGTSFQFYLDNSSSRVHGEVV